MAQTTPEATTTARETQIPDGPTQRHVLLKRNYLRQVPTITIHRARIITEMDRANPGLPRIELTTIEQPKKLLASMAVDSLLDKIENELAGYTHRVLTPSLVERTTCRAINGQE